MPPLTFAKGKARAAEMASLEGWDNVSPPPDWDALFNRAYEQFAWDAECVIASETVPTAIGVQEYQLANVYKAILDVACDSLPVYRSTEDFERRVRADWRLQLPGIPQRWTFTDFSSITLVPPPNGVLPLEVRGITFAAPLTGELDVPVIPMVYHEALAAKACALHATIYAQGESLSRIQVYEAIYEAAVADCLKVQEAGYQKKEGSR